MEIKFRVMYFEDGGKGHKPKNQQPLEPGKGKETDFTLNVFKRVAQQ